MTARTQVAPDDIRTWYPNAKVFTDEDTGKTITYEQDYVRGRATKQAQLGLLFKVLDKDGKASHGGDMTWSLPTITKTRTKETVTPGDWMEITEPLALCRRGLHVTSRDYLSHWVRENSRVFVVEVDGPGLDGGDKVCVARARLTEEVPPDLVKHLSQMVPFDSYFEHALGNFESQFIRDNAEAVTRILKRIMPKGLSAYEREQVAEIAAQYGQRYIHVNVPARKMALNYFRARKKYLQTIGKTETPAQVQERERAKDFAEMLDAFADSVRVGFIYTTLENASVSGKRLVARYNRERRALKANARTTWEANTQAARDFLAAHGA